MGLSKKERAAASRENANWLDLEVAIDDLRDAVRKRDKDSASIAFEALEEKVAQLRGHEVEIERLTND